MNQMNMYDEHEAIMEDLNRNKMTKEKEKRIYSGPHHSNQWAALLYFADDKRGLDAEVVKIYAEFLGKNPTVDQIKNCIDEGMGIYTEPSLNALIKSFGLKCDQIETGNGYATFKNIKY